VIKRVYDSRTGRPLVDAKDAVDGLTDDELEVELTVAAAEPVRRGRRLGEIVVERARRRKQRERVLG
jgi:hypothetical protein